MWTDAGSRLTLGLVACLISACAGASQRSDSGERLVILSVETMTSARQRVRIEVDDGDPKTAPVTATADLPAHTTSGDHVGRLWTLLEVKGVPVTMGESPRAGHAPADTEALFLPPGYRVVALTIEKKAGDAWVPSGPADLVRLAVP